MSLDLHHDYHRAALGQRLAVVIVNDTRCQMTMATAAWWLEEFDARVDRLGSALWSTGFATQPLRDTARQAANEMLRQFSGINDAMAVKRLLNAVAS